MKIEKGLLKKIEDITLTDYEATDTKNENEAFVDVEGIICMLEDLLLEIGRLEEQIEDMHEYYQEHYRYVPEKIDDLI